MASRPRNGRLEPWPSERDDVAPLGRDPRRALASWRSGDQKLVPPEKLNCCNTSALLFDVAKA